MRKLLMQVSNTYRVKEGALIVSFALSRRATLSQTWVTAGIFCIEVVLADALMREHTARQEDEQNTNKASEWGNISLDPNEVVYNNSLFRNWRGTRKSVVCVAAPAKKAESAAKNARQAVKRRVGNKAKKSEMKTILAHKINHQMDVEGLKKVNKDKKFMLEVPWFKS
ncbi:hypothetical protein C5167_042887 [Papaver somniferum]|uniref:Uncharacterized protein n=1 Tax=Papaver somniferum TaxID=3469 RepID=A0A4Y7L7F4_PAPSO|nr:hypothetical protein C5167_042887 [Papaver somniferum]